MLRPALTAVAVLAGCGSTPPPTSAPSKGDAESTERTTYRQAIGGLAAGYLYQTHLFVGSAADLLAKGAYKPQDVLVLMDTTMGMGQNVNEILEKVRELELGTADAGVVDDMLETNRLLIEEAEALKTFARQMNAENARAFDQRRQVTWRRLSKLLNIEDSRQ